MKLDLVPILEAAYAVEEAEWLQRLLDAMRPSFDRGLGICVFPYDASDPSRLTIGDVIELGSKSPVTANATGHGIISGIDSGTVRNTYRLKVTAMASEEPLFHEPYGARDYLGKAGIGDVHVVNTLDASGKGLVFSSYVPKKVSRLTSRERMVWERVGFHLAAAYRLRRRLRSRARRESAAGGTTETILTRTGALEQAGPDAQEARAVLRQAVVSYGRAKRAMRRDADAVGDWQVLVDRRWSLLDRFEKDGSQYVIASRNDAPAKGPRSLTKRERQVLSAVALGQENKLVAYTLGISHATVRVLLSRAAAKLGVRTREELVAAFIRAAMEPKPDASE